MPIVTFRKGGVNLVAAVQDNTNLVVRAGIRKFPYPLLRYGCGMGQCGKCACRVLEGAEHLPPPNWKEARRLGPRLEQGYRLCCQLWLHHDITLEQDEPSACTSS
jgi:ferredoxin